LSQLSAFIDAEVVYHQQSLDILQALQDILKRKYVVTIALCHAAYFQLSTCLYM